MRDNSHTHNFRFVEGVWRDVTGKGETLAEVLEQYELIIDDKCQFARFRDNYFKRSIIFRAWDGGNISIDVQDLDE